MNLADNLTATAKAHPTTSPSKLDDFELTYAGLNGASNGGRLAARPGGGARRSRRHHAAERAAVPDHLLRRPARRRHRGADEPAAQGARVEYYLSDSGAKVLFGWEDSPKKPMTLRLPGSSRWWMARSPATRIPRPGSGGC